MLIVLTSSFPLLGQRTQTVAAGTRVRLSAPTFVNGFELTRSDRFHAGTLVSVDSTSVTVQLAGDSVLLTVPFSAIRRMDVSAGMLTAREGARAGLRKGALTGGGVIVGGFGIVLLTQLAFSAAPEHCFGSDDGCDRWRDVPFATVGLIAAGSTVLGALIGVAGGSHTRERWRKVRPRRIAPFAPATGGLGLALRL